jgi:hypothetical protein
MDTNRVVAASLFEPIEKANIVTTIVIKITSVVVGGNYLKLLSIGNNIVLPPLNMVLSIIYTSSPEPSLRCRSKIINPKLDKSSLLY